MSKNKFKEGCTVKLNYPVNVRVNDWICITLQPDKKGDIIELLGDHVYDWGIVVSFELELLDGTVFTVHKSFNMDEEGRDYSLVEIGI